MSQKDDQSVRTPSASSNSGRSVRDKRGNPQQPLSQIEKSVTHLLVATKQLLETLTQWSRRLASEGEVSDVYVRLGYEFNIACRAFSAIGVDTSDLGPVPDLLRTILEETLSQEASQASLERFLPRIRDIIINLLQGLKRKQQRLRSKNGKESGSISTTRQSSVGSSGSAEESSNRHTIDASIQNQEATESTTQGLAGLPPRTSSAGPSTGGRSSPSKHESVTQLSDLRRSNSLGREPEKFGYSTTSESPISSSAIPDIPLITSTSQDEDILPPHPTPATSSSALDLPQLHLTQEPLDSRMLVQPKQHDALVALQRGGELERRASRRFSAYQIQKQLGTSSNGIPIIPPTQTSPAPNRGRDVKESMNAVRVRNTTLGRERSKYSQNRYDGSPNRQHTRQDRISEERDVTLQGPHQVLGNALDNHGPIESSGVATVILEQPKQSPLTSRTFDDEDEATKSTVLNLQDQGEPSFSVTKQGSEEPLADEASKTTSSLAGVNVPARRSSKKHTLSGGSQSDRSSGTKELTLFLQYKTKIKKFVLSEGYEELSIARLQLAFIEKFAWNTHGNGMDLPEIYIQDPISGIRYELEDLNDVKNNSVLALNVDELDEVKRHMDDGLGGLRQVIEGVKTSIEGQQNFLQRMSDKQADVAKEVVRFSSSSSPMISSRNFPPEIVPGIVRSSSVRGNVAQLTEVQSLRRELGVIRQTYTNFVSDIESSMSEIREKAATIKNAAADAANDPSSLEGDSGRSYVNNGKKTLSEDSEKIINRVDDLQDVVEDLRKDVVMRGVRPLPRQLESVSKEISAATVELKRLQEYIKREKPTWTKIWKNELQVVCDDQNLLTMQEELAADLEDDLEKAAQTFALVEEATKQQNLQNTSASGSRSTSRNLNPPNLDVDPQKAKDGVLGEVRALQPNHETRLEAIERAEKARQRELENRSGGEFKKELGNFVDEGKLKKSGGFEEAERQRTMKDERMRKEVWERMSSRSPSRELDTKANEASTEASTSPPSSTDLNGEGKTTPDEEFVEAVEQPVANGGGSGIFTETT